MRAVVLWCGAYTRDKRDWDDVARSREDIQHGCRAAVAWGAQRILVFVPDDSVLPHPESNRWPHLRWRRAEPAALDEELAGLAKEGVNELLFVATNHGHPDGLALQPGTVDIFDDAEPGPFTLTPGALAASLDRVPGAQVVLVATCYAGVFLDLASDRRHAVVSCGREQVYWIAQEDRPYSPILRFIFDEWARGPGRLEAAVQAAINDEACRRLDGLDEALHHRPAAAGACPRW